MGNKKLAGIDMPGCPKIKVTDFNIIEIG